MRLRKFTRGGYFFICCVRVAPKEVFLYRPGKEEVFLQYHRDPFSQHTEVIVSHVNTADADLAARHVIETRDQLNESGF